LILSSLSGCSEPAHPSGQISEADRIVTVTNEGHNFTVTVTGDNASALAKAVASSKEDKVPISATFDWDVQLFKGTNLLTVIRLQHNYFLLAGTQYEDDSGVLEAFYRKLLSEEEARR
jgi:hypothetical protein